MIFSEAEPQLHSVYHFDPLTVRQSYGIVICPRAVLVRFGIGDTVFLGYTLPPAYIGPALNKVWKTLQIGDSHGLWYVGRWQLVTPCLLIRNR